MGNFLSKKSNATGSNSNNNGGRNGKKPPAKKSTPNSPVISEYDRCVLELKLQRDKLNKHSKAIHSFSERQSELAKEFLRQGRRESALTCVRRRRMHEGQLRKVESFLENVDKMICTVEFASIEQEVIHSLKSGANAIQDLHKTMSIDKVEAIHDEAAEAIQLTKEVGDLLAEQLGPRDEEAAEEEVAQLELELAGPVPTEKLPDTTKVPEGLGEVNVPTSPIAAEPTPVVEEESKEKEREIAVA